MEMAPAISSCRRASNHESGLKEYGFRPQANLLMNQTDSEFGRPPPDHSAPLVNTAQWHPQPAVEWQVAASNESNVFRYPDSGVQDCRHGANGDGSLRQKIPVGRGSRLITLTAAWYPASEAWHIHQR
jgi:hypothetical protein